MTSGDGLCLQNGMILKKEIDKLGIQSYVLVVPSKFRRKVLTICS